jgi:hypothetical protein
VQVNPVFDDEDWIEVTDMEESIMLTERKSKYKHKVTVPSDFTGDLERSIRDWCTEQFGAGGRNRHLRWRFGWVQNKSTFYFKNDCDVSLFLLRWA